MQSRNAKFGIGQVVKHRFYPFRGVIFDVDPIFSNTRGMVEFDPRRGSSGQGAAVLSPLRRKRR